MNDFINPMTELVELINKLNMEILALKAEIEDIKTIRQNMDVLLDAKGVKAKTGWSLKTAQKALQDPRMITVWLGKGPQVTIKELERYCCLNINRATDKYWKE